MSGSPNVPEINGIAAPLMQWFDKNARDLPWRRDPSPYNVWVSEIMLQQTRVDAVIPYFERFIAALPGVEALAECPEDLLMKLWEGLGYYSRVRNMQKAARIVKERFGGELPSGKEELLALPGIGEYTAGAVSSIAYGRREAAVDGNVLRVMSRLQADREDISSQSVKSRVREQLLAIIPEDAPGTFNQAMMELGALICLPNGRPACGICPLAHCCRARQEGCEEELPVKKPKAGRKKEERTILLLVSGDGKIALRKRPPRGLLAGLYEFPGLEGHPGPQQIRRRLLGEGLDPESFERLADSSHIFTHIEWQMHGWLVRLRNDSGKESLPDGLVFETPRRALDQYSLPSAFAAYKTALQVLTKTERSS